jgi:hypothetical protein
MAKSNKGKGAGAKPAPVTDEKDTVVDDVAPVTDEPVKDNALVDVEFTQLCKLSNGVTYMFGEKAVLTPELVKEAKAFITIA